LHPRRWKTKLFVAKKELVPKTKKKNQNTGDGGGVYCQRIAEPFRGGRTTYKSGQQESEHYSVLRITTEDQGRRVRRLAPQNRSASRARSRGEVTSDIKTRRMKGPTPDGFT